MKIYLKFTATLVCLFIIVNLASAQLLAKKNKTPIGIKSEETKNISATVDKKVPFVGIWELYKTASNGLPLQAYPPGYIKIYEPDGKFTIIRVQQGGSIIKSSGYYAIDDDMVCREADKLEELSTKGFKINYEFSHDNKVLTIGFSYPDGAAYTEAYRKLEPKAN